MEKHVLIINLSSSKCATCGKEAFPDTVTHDKVAGYGGGQPGCGCKWTHVTTDYVDSSGRVEAATRAKRPDLVYIPVENRYPGVR